MGGRERFVIRADDGTSMQIPRGWTDADGPSTSDQEQHRGTFSVESLRRLTDLVDALSRRSS